MKKIYLLGSLLLLQHLSLAQQDPQYNLYQFNQLVINPAYAGARNGLSAIASTRQQWTSIDGAPQTTCFSVHSPFLEKNVGLGLTIINDKLGPKSMVGIYGNAAYILKLNREWRLSFGLSAGYNRYQFFSDKLSMQTIESTGAFMQDQISNALDMSGGFYLKSNDFFIGLSATHLNTPSINSYEALNGSLKYDLKTHLFLTAGKSFKFSDQLLFAPSFLFKFVNGQIGTDINLNFLIHKKLWLGAFYKYGYGPGALMQYHITNIIRISYSYDTGLSDARRLGGSHEIMLGFDLAAKKAKVINPRFL